MSRPQILALAVDPDFAHRLLAAGRLHALHLGVYAVGHASPTREGRWMAAVLAVGDGAVLSHLSAVLLWSIVDRAGDLIHVLAADGGSRSRPGLVIHRTPHLPPEHRTERSGVPVTTVARTLLDLAAMLSPLSPKRLRFAVEAADRSEHLDVPALVALCDASPGRKGTGALRRLALEQRGATARTKSPPESTFLRVCRNRGLPEPLVNSPLHGYEVDFHWPHARLVVEIDTYTYHRSRAQRQRDLERDADLEVHGEEVVRFTRERVEAAAVAVQVAALLEMRAAAALPTAPDHTGLVI